jgi:hypothetical protein
MGISTPAASTLTLNITRHNWAQANKRRKIAVTNAAGRFILLPPIKWARPYFPQTAYALPILLPLFAHLRPQVLNKAHVGRRNIHLP